MNLRRVFSPIPWLLALAPLACSAAGTTEDQSEDPLTSVTARSRELKFQGYVYVRRGASDYEILGAVRAETQTAFGALRTAQVGVNSRELKDVDPTTFVKEDVDVVDTDATGSATPTPMTRVRYVYTDNAVVPVEMARRSALSVAVMSPSYKSQTSRILGECTANDSEAQEFQGSIWYVFDPSLSGCKTAMTKEQQAIDTASKKLTDATKQVSKLEANRLYLPITVALGADKTNKGISYPEYDKLFTGGVQKGHLVVGMVSGFIDHGAHNDYTDSGYSEWLEQLREAFRGHDFKLVKSEPAEDLSTYTVNGKSIASKGFDDILTWELDGGSFPSGVDYPGEQDLRRQAGDKIIRHWLTFETKVNVSIGGAAPQPLAIDILTYFGAEEDPTPHKRGIKNSDVFIYNGHSYIGYGPLDPSNFSSSDFPSSYQILFMDGCVSYNYYEKDYFPLHSGGTKTLELVTNGLEAPAYHSGYALGRFTAMLLDGTQHSYLDLLRAAEATDPLRVVDGEVDNTYDPSKTPITLE